MAEFTLHFCPQGARISQTFTIIESECPAHARGREGPVVSNDWCIMISLFTDWFRKQSEIMTEYERMEVNEMNK